jgi:hypothetical protein
MDEEPAPFANEINISTRSHGKIALPILTTVYLRVEHDILCLPCLDSINIPHFLSCPEHQALKFIAVREQSLPNVSTSYLGQVFFGLKNLEIIYVVECSHQWPRPNLSELEKERVKKFKNGLERVWHSCEKRVTWRKEPIFIIKTLITDS